jgi:hypothetical protein
MGPRPFFTETNITVTRKVKKEYTMPETEFKLLTRDRDILEHLVRYRVGLLTTLSQAVFDGGEPGRPLSYLARDGFIQRHTRTLDNNVTYVTPTAEAYRALGLKANARTTAALSGVVLDNAIALTFACHLGSARRHRITRVELVEIIESENDAPPPNIFFVVSEEVGYAIILRVVFAQTVGPKLIEKLQRHIDESTKKNPTLAPWLSAGDYGFLVLVKWPDKLEEVRSLIAESQMSKNYVVLCDIGPDTTTLATFLKKRKGPSNG